MTLGPPQVPIALVGTAHVSQASADYTREAILVSDGGAGGWWWWWRERAGARKSILLVATSMLQAHMGAVSVGDRHERRGMPCFACKGT
jgi:hypothetical protein